MYFSPPASLEHAKVGWDTPGLETPAFQAEFQPIVLLREGTLEPSRLFYLICTFVNVYNFIFFKSFLCL